MTVCLGFAIITLLIWLYLALCHAQFWHADPREPQEAHLPEESTWPAVVAVVPARDEAQLLPECLPTLIAQAYPGDFAIVLVDDQSTDGTGDLARTLAQNAAVRVEVITSRERPSGWTGKVWAQAQCIAHVEKMGVPCTHLLLTDADIAYAPEALQRLSALARRQNTVLTSLMVKLNCQSFAERTLIPAFVFFFEMLYPFRAVNDPQNKTAAAAGGCMLVERAALQRAGGIGVIRSALIDDCALAKVLKSEGSIWLGLAESVRSVRPYPYVRDIAAMVTRSAYAQLRYSPLLLALTVLGMVLTYVLAPLLALLAPFPANAVAFLAYALMCALFVPMLRYYRLSPLFALTLPVMAAAYLAFTLNSAYQQYRGRGGMWKGRAQAGAEKLGDG